jgi:DNA-binding MarR family transcriptional regulator
MDADLTDYSTPTLMRAARGVYAQSIRAHLAALGISDLPRNGIFVLAGIDSSGEMRADLPAGLGVSKQAVSQVIDILVNRGYVTRRPDPVDRRRIVLELTGRGQEALAAAADGVDDVERRLTERVPPGQLEAMRSALRALGQIKADAAATGAGRRRATGQLRSFSPIFPVRNMATALAHYASLGFETSAYDGTDYYGFADRDGVGLHLATDDGHEHSHPGAAYLYVRDADALYAEWTRPGIGGHTHPVSPTDYKLREGSHTDPDGNLIRFGSPMPE